MAVFLLQDLPVGSRAEKWVWGGSSRSVCFLVQPAQECRGERERVGQLEREAQKDAGHQAEMGMESLGITLSVAQHP